METLINEWVEAANAFDTDAFLMKFDANAVLDDSSLEAYLEDTTESKNTLSTILSAIIPKPGL